jgi:hypothetical protein
VLLHRSRADVQDRPDLRIAFPRRHPSQYFRLAFGERTGPVDPGENPSQVRSHEVEHGALAVGEVAPCAVEHEAHQHSIGHVDGHCHRMVYAHATVVVVVKPAAPELRQRQRIADAPSESASLKGVVAHQRMLVEVAVEGSAILGAERAGRQAEHLTPATGQVTDG